MPSSSYAPASGPASRESAGHSSAFERVLAFWRDVPAPTGPLRPLFSGTTCAVAVLCLALLSGVLFLVGAGTMAAGAPIGLGLVVILLNYPGLAFLFFMLAVGLNWTIADWPTSPTKAGAGLVVGMTVVNLMVRGMKPRFHWMHLWLLAFAFWSLVSANIVGNGATSSGYSYTMIGWALVLICAHQLFQGPAGLRTMFAYYALGATAGCIMTIATYGQGGMSTFVPIAGDVNDFGMLASSGAVVAVGLAREKYAPALRVFWLLCALICLTVAVGSLSRGTLMGLGAAVVVHFLLQPKDRKAIVIAVLAVLALGACIYPFVADQVQVALDQKSFVAQGNVSSRFDAWAVALQQGAQHPVTGIGIGSLQAHYAHALHLPPGALDLAYAHNTYIEIFYGTGVIGLVLMGMAIGWSLWTGYRAQRVDPEFLEVSDGTLEPPHVGGVRGVILPALISVFVACLTVTEIMYPPFWMAFLLALGGFQAAGQPVSDVLRRGRGRRVPNPDVAPGASAEPERAQREALA